MKPAAKAVIAALRDEGPSTATALAKRTGRSEPYVRQLLRELAQRGHVRKFGRTRDASWALPDEVEDAARNSRIRVRDEGIRLGGFLVEDMCEAVPELSEGTVREALRYWEARGTFAVRRLDDNRKRYDYVRPVGVTTARPKIKPPEVLVRDRRAKGVAVQGTGRQARPTDHEVAKLFDEIMAAGGELERRADHWRVTYGGHIIATLPGTPSSYRGLKNARADCRRGGLPLP